MYSIYYQLYIYKDGSQKVCSKEFFIVAKLLMAKSIMSIYDTNLAYYKLFLVTLIRWIFRLYMKLYCH